MFFSQHSLHHPVIIDFQHKDIIRAKLHSIFTDLHQFAAALVKVEKGAPSIEIPLTTVSLDSNFDAYINIRYPEAPSDTTTQLLVDSGNAALIVPRWEDIQAIPNWSSSYTILGTANEPWGCPANVVRGPIECLTITGALYQIPNCVFYACNADNPNKNAEPRTANFGAGCIVPWSASTWNSPQAGIIMQSPLSYNLSYPCAEFHYASSSVVLTDSPSPTVDRHSSLILYPSVPSGYTMFDILPNLDWMSLTPKSLSIGAVKTGWPGTVPAPIAMMDTGGGTAFLSDPNAYIYQSWGVSAVACPTWTASSTNCACIRDAITIELGDAHFSYSYVIDTSRMPASVAGLTLVMCQNNSFMMGQQGMNIGGISLLFNDLLIDYKEAKIGLKAKG